MRALFWFSKNRIYADSMRIRIKKILLQGVGRAVGGSLRAARRRGRSNCPEAGSADQEILHRLQAGIKQHLHSIPPC